jgi:hypothetical protein
MGRYMSEGGLRGAREEIVLVTSEYLPFAPLWIKGDSLANTIRSGLANLFVCLFVCLIDSTRLFVKTV